MVIVYSNIFLPAILGDLFSADTNFNPPNREALICYFYWTSSCHVVKNRSWLIQSLFLLSWGILLLNDRKFKEAFRFPEICYNLIFFTALRSFHYIVYLSFVSDNWQLFSIKVGVRSLGWIELNEDTLTSENSSKAVSFYLHLIETHNTQMYFIYILYNWILLLCNGVVLQ